uniref:Uncharacterized protein n=1 Tax=Oryza nivara TaxID=4536 RepID=A0A0E0FVC6_ORYNI
MLRLLDRHGEVSRQLPLHQRCHLQLRILRVRAEPELVDAEHGEHRVQVREADQEGGRLLLRGGREPVHAGRRGHLRALLPLAALLGALPAEVAAAVPEVRRPHRQRLRGGRTRRRGAARVRRPGRPAHHELREQRQRVEPEELRDQDQRAAALVGRF